MEPASSARERVCGGLVGAFCTPACFRASVRPSVPELISTMTEPILMSDGLSERYLAGEETKFFFRKKIFFKIFLNFSKNFFLQIWFLVGLYGGPGCALQN